MKAFIASGAEIFNLATGSGFLMIMSIATGAIKSSIINPGPKSIDFIGLIEKGVRSKALETGRSAIEPTAMAPQKLTLGNKSP